MSLTRFADPIAAFITETSLGNRPPVTNVVPDGDDCDHIALLLRKGVRTGIGLVQWTLRTAIGIKLEQADLDAIAGHVEEGALYDPDGKWRIEVRQ